MSLAHCIDQRSEALLLRWSPEQWQRSQMKELRGRIWLIAEAQIKYEKEEVRMRRAYTALMRKDSIACHLPQQVTQRHSPATLRKDRHSYVITPAGDAMVAIEPKDDRGGAASFSQFLSPLEIISPCDFKKRYRICRDVNYQKLGFVYEWGVYMSPAQKKYSPFESEAIQLSLRFDAEAIGPG